MAKRPPRETATARATAERARTRRALAVMAGTVVLLAALLLAAWLPKQGPAEAEHPHQPAPHGGTVVPLGEGDSHFHIEAVLLRGGSLILYTVGRDAATVIEVEAETLTARIMHEKSRRSARILLSPKPQAGDAEGKTSRFVGRVPRELREETLVVIVPGIAIAGKRYQPVNFTLPALTPAERENSKEQ